MVLPHHIVYLREDLVSVLWNKGILFFASPFEHSPEPECIAFP